MQSARIDAALHYSELLDLSMVKGNVMVFLTEKDGVFLSL